MRRLLTRMAGRLWRDTGAAAVVEFALVMPVMLLLYLGTIEASALISMDKRVQTIAGAIGDLVARSDSSVTTAQLNDYFAAASTIMAPYPTTTLVQTVSVVRILSNGTTSVQWSRRSTNGGTAVVGRATNSAYPLPNEIRVIARDGYVVVSETQYRYRPLQGLIFQQEVPLYRENFYLPRFGGTITCC